MVPLGSGTGVLVVVHNVQVIVGVTMIVGVIAVVAVTMVFVIVGAVNDGVTLQFSGTERKKLPCLVRYSKRAE